MRPRRRGDAGRWRPCDDRAIQTRVEGRGLPAAPVTWEKGTGSPSKPPEISTPARTLTVDSGFQNCEDQSLSFEASWFLVLCRGALGSSCGKLVTWWPRVNQLRGSGHG